MRTIDRRTAQDYQIPSLQLMKNAAKACFLEINNFYSGKLYGRNALIVCGEGNNGGDGAALAKELLDAGVTTDVVLIGSIANTKGDARVYFERVHQLANQWGGSSSSISLKECNSEDDWDSFEIAAGSRDLIVDALFGTGLSRPLNGVFRTVVKNLNRIRNDRKASSNPSLFLSVDIPSGLQADRPDTWDAAVEADVTVTFTAPKVANVLAPAANYNGRLIVADIGSPQELIEAADSNLFIINACDARDWLGRTRYKSGSFKNTHGHVLVIAGSRGYTGAAVLSGNAAMRSGAGLVTIATAVSSQPAVAATAMPEVMTAGLAETDSGAISDKAIEDLTRLAAKASVIAIGPGLSSQDERTRRLVYSVVENRKVPVVIDADALNCLSPWPASLKGSKEAPLILTPHPGEMLRLIGTEDKSTLNDRVSLAKEFAEKHNVILVLKGSPSLTAADGTVFISSTGNPGLGTAGSGDTLTGVIAGFIAQELGTKRDEVNVLNATLAALYVGGLAGDIAAKKMGMRSMVASDIRSHLGEAIRSLDPEGESPTNR